MTWGVWVVLGVTGQLGHEIIRQPPPHSVDVIGVSRQDLDFTRPDSIHDTIAKLNPDLVINAAAWTDVDGAQANEVVARQVNAEGVAHLASACRDHDARLIHVSTDYVFGTDAHTHRPWAEDDPRNPQGVYARTKAEGEVAVGAILPDTGVVVRTAWLYSAQGRNFARTMLAKARAGEPVRVVDDQWGQPTWARDVAAQILDLAGRFSAGTAPAGAYHAVNSGMATWWEFARAIYTLTGADPQLVSAMSSEDLTRPAPRPSWSVLACDRWALANMAPLRPWHDALTEAMPSLTP